MPGGADPAGATADIEATEADAAEQHAEVVPRESVDPVYDPPADVDPADLADQHRVVELDDDDYR
ncbi:MAG: hypothetical protein M3P48_07770 [Actinomycetota bacterium]|nr:hypothetical protein [Actinomycetota bacterium]